MASQMECGLCDVYVIQRASPESAQRGLRLYGTVSALINTKTPPVDEGRDLIYLGQTVTLKIRQVFPEPPHSLARELGVAALLDDLAAARALADHLSEDVVRAANKVPTYDCLRQREVEQDKEIKKLRDEVAQLSRQVQDLTPEDIVDQTDWDALSMEDL